MGKRFITARDIDDLIEQGQQEIHLDTDTVVTDAARERARERGLRLCRCGASSGEATPAPSGTGPLPGAPQQGQPGGSDAALAAAVERAVVAHLGKEPPGLRDVINRILQRR
ncbi:hypothetical protein AU468_06500 [Alkalispirochaeta sphaeroplastigenens]|uniref:Uncharacterized protein n=1 Tax=Alkalispirochaeta sphaeroplastigenens TaxID=1187066 RepID=A0A2S4JRU7_9SPIO|nr:hypothetical protein [Alkalispirochaeta sphaeroplastigenens]POR02236.1 hypothetical protein AU468_06500 [Alkalispirochaeta sphaeroplastigenens]